MPQPPRDPRKTAPAAAPRRRIRPMRWLKSLLKGRLRFERRGIHIHVKLDPAVLPETVMPQTPAATGGEALRQAHAALRRMLDHHPDARRTLKHLVFVEEMIARNGSRALKKIPAPVLRKAQGQLELLTRDAPHATLEALGFLHERIEVALHGRRNDPGAQTRPQEIQVLETTHSVFDEEERRWTDQMPLDGPIERRP